MIAKDIIERSTTIKETEDYELRVVDEQDRVLENGVSGLFINYIIVGKAHNTIELYGAMLGWIDHQLGMIQAATSQGDVVDGHRTAEVIPFPSFEDTEEDEEPLH